MPVAFNLDHISVSFSAEILQNVAANVIPNLTVFGERFAEISPNEVYVAVFGPPCTLHMHQHTGTGNITGNNYFLTYKGNWVATVLG